MVKTTFFHDAPVGRRPKKYRDPPIRYLEKREEERKIERTNKIELELRAFSYAQG